MSLPRKIWPGKAAWIVGPSGRESADSRHARRLARERALYRKQHPGSLRRAASGLRKLLGNH